MDTILLPMLPFLVFLAFLLYHSFQRVNCPDCGALLPQFLSPFKKTRQMWLAGGYLCTRCGCETNLAGQKVTADTPPAPFPTLACVLVTVSLLVGVGLTTVAFAMINQPVPVVDVPLSALELQAPRPPAALPPEIEPPLPPVFVSPPKVPALAPVPAPQPDGDG